MSYDDHGIPIIGPPPEDKDAEAKVHRKAERTYQDQQTMLQRGILRTQMFLVVFGLIGAVVSIRQSSQATASLKATIDNFHQEQRAWISIPKIDVVFDPQEPLTFTVHQFNSGKTPAQNIESYTTGIPLFKNQVPRIDFSKGKRVGGYIAPNSEYTVPINLTRTTGILGQKGVDEIVNGAWTPYIIGLIKYEDVFQRNHITRFCYYIQMEKNGREWGLQACPNKAGTPPRNWGN